jgi:hypothetical protein
LADLRFSFLCAVEMARIVQLKLRASGNGNLHEEFFARLSEKLFVLRGTEGAG